MSPFRLLVAFWDTNGGKASVRKNFYDPEEQAPGVGQYKLDLVCSSLRIIELPIWLGLAKKGCRKG